VVNVRHPMLLSVILVAACAAQAGRPGTVATAPPANRAALEAKAVAWTRTSAELFPRSPARVQIVITPGWADGQHYAWLIANGTDVIRVYRSTGSEISDIVDAAIRTVYPTTGTPLDQLSIGIVGSFHKPPPPPPDPGGFPEAYVQEVMRTAWGIDRQQMLVGGTQIGDQVGH
jgi:hypothetical protein